MTFYDWLKRQKLDIEQGYLRSLTTETFQ